MFAFAFQDNYREDRLSDGIGEFIEKGAFHVLAYFCIVRSLLTTRIEYKRSKELVGDKDTQDIGSQMMLQSSISARTLQDFIGDLPLVSLVSISSTLRLI